LTRSLVVRFIILAALLSSVCLPLLSQNKRRKSPGPTNSSGSKKASNKKQPQAKPSPAPLPPLMTYVFKTVALRDDGTLESKDILDGSAKYFTQEIGGVSFEMMEIPEGVFQMGSDDAQLKQSIRQCEQRCKDDVCRAACDGIVRSETPQHTVKIQKFYISRYEVTQAQWDAIRQLDTIKFRLPYNPSLATHDPTQDGDRPVERVTWTEAKEFCRLLSQKTKRNYRLPTEAEWEYACRANTKTPFAFGTALNSNFVNFAGATNRRTTLPVKIRAYANKFGLFDMHGNIAEWCEDSWHDNYLGNPPQDGTAWVEKGKTSRTSGRTPTNSTPSFRVVRGGSWEDTAYACRCAARKKVNANERNAGVGFRIILDPR